ncbi:DUF2313 domain-containing protein [Sphingomonas sp. AOB5]|uniref:YmfQ family protein n=1 Tax=Sphingomonas sp. AOB5 TaxID=3034017 RepID=UPI0023F6721A|nr:putative phage tail protein [Sphingomonas sp. AOB5]MDF7777859.1 DUF2313 domain-containing protein [Sphingomonas sp. AOB5]
MVLIRDARSYLGQMQALLPTGAAWPRERTSWLARLLRGMAEEPARLDARMAQLEDEADPRTAFELLPDWERVLGLPDPCTPAETTIAARQAACWRKLAFQAGQTPAFYIEMAATLGFDIEIHEFDPDVDDFDGALTALITDGRWRYVWRVHVLNAGTFSVFRMGDLFGGRFVEGDAALVLECVFRGAKPAHTHVIFSYPEE